MKLLKDVACVEQYASIYQLNDKFTENLFYTANSPRQHEGLDFNPTYLFLGMSLTKLNSKVLDLVCLLTHKLRYRKLNISNSLMDHDQSEKGSANT